MIGRVRDRATFHQFRRGRRYREGPLTLVVVDAGGIDDGGLPRVAFGVSRRVGTAVTRNRVRRRLRAALTAHAGRLRRGAAYLVVAEPAAAATSYQDLEDTVATLVARAGGEA